MTNYGLQFQKDVSDIQSNQDLAAGTKTNMMITAQKVYESAMNNTAALYNVTLDWETPL